MLYYLNLKNDSENKKYINIIQYLKYILSILNIENIKKGSLDYIELLNFEVETLEAIFKILNNSKYYLNLKNEELFLVVDSKLDYQIIELLINDALILEKLNYSIIENLNFKKQLINLNNEDILIFKVNYQHFDIIENILTLAN